MRIIFIFALIALAAASSLLEEDGVDSFQAQEVAPKRRFLKSIGNSISSGAKAVASGASSAVKSVSSGASSAVKSVSSGVSSAVKAVADSIKKLAASVRGALQSLLSKIVPRRVKESLKYATSHPDPMPFANLKDVKAPLYKYVNSKFCSTCPYGNLVAALKKFMTNGGPDELNSAVGKYAVAMLNPLNRLNPSKTGLEKALSNFGGIVNTHRPKKTKRDDPEAVARSFIKSKNAKLRRDMDELRRITDTYNITRRGETQKQGMGFWTIDLDASLIGGGQVLFGMAINHHDHKSFFMICTHYALGASVGVSAGISGGYDWKSVGEDYLQSKNWKGGYSGSFSVFADFYAGFELGFGSSRPFGHALGGGATGFDQFDLGQIQFGVSGGIGAGPYSFLQGRCWTW